MVVWSATLVVVTVAYLLVCTDRHATGIRGKLRHFVFSTVPSKIKGDNVLIRPIKTCVNKVFFERNHYIQCLYLMLAVGGFFIYVKDGFPLAPCRYVGAVHKYTGTLVMIACYWSYYKVCAADPGYINAGNHA